MNKLLTAFLSILFILQAGNAAAKDAVYNGEQYSIALSYTDSVSPGDAVVVRMKFSRGGGAQNLGRGTLSASLAAHGIGKTEFFQLPAKGLGTHGETEMLAALPLSTYQETGSIDVKVIYSAFGGESMEFTLPVAIVPKEFVSETIPLNESNTQIRTDTSPERIAQIDKLNTILETIHPDAVYQTGPFTPPTDAARRTSFFGDRRIYQYADGETASSLHYGIDYGIPTGTPVNACGNGKVVLAENRISTGWSVVIEHLPGLYSLYYHLDSIDIKAGAMVRQGDRIGKSGATGLATGPHLHWEIRLNMAAVNPDFFTGNFLFSDKD